MKANENKVDRIVRVIIGVALVLIAFFVPHAWWALLGFIPLATGAVGFCPLYRVFGFSTCPNGDCTAS